MKLMEKRQNMEREPLEEYWFCQQDDSLLQKTGEMVFISQDVDFSLKRAGKMGKLESTFHESARTLAQIYFEQVPEENEFSFYKARCPTCGKITLAPTAFHPDKVIHYPDMPPTSYEYSVKQEIMTHLKIMLVVHFFLICSVGIYYVSIPEIKLTSLLLFYLVFAGSIQLYEAALRVVFFGGVTFFSENTRKGFLENKTQYYMIFYLVFGLLAFFQSFLLSEILADLLGVDFP